MIMMGVICFVLLVPLAMERHNAVLSVAIVALFVVYIGANVLLWLRLRPRA
jgi:amino acid transporter